MTLLLISVIWVFASAAVALLPIQKQIIPGVVLMALGPVLVVIIAMQVGAMGGVFAAWAYYSMYRNPLKHLWTVLRGENQNVIPDPVE